MSTLGHIGIAFAGGGGKGAWQIGVWKALEERGIRARAVSGTSVGTLNAVLYAQGNLEQAEKAWLSISNDKLLQPNWEQLGKKLGKIISKGITWEKLTNRYGSTGCISENGLKTLIDTYMDFGNRENFLPTFATAHCEDDYQVHYFDLFMNPRQTEEDMRNIMLASAAIPHVFSNVTIDGKTYSDGGFDFIYAATDRVLRSNQYNNAPIEPLMDHAEKLGIDTVVLLALNRDELIRRPDYGALRVLPFLPSESLGGMLDGCLDFNPEHARQRMNQGYQDAQKILDLFSGFQDNEARLNDLWQALADKSVNYLDALNDLAKGYHESMRLEDDAGTFHRMLQQDHGEKRLEIAPNPLSLEEAIVHENRLFLDMTDLERSQINAQLDLIIDENRGNSELLSHFALDAISAWSPVESRSREVLDQGFFGRLWHGLTGNNQTMTSQSLINLSQAQYSSFMMLEKLQKENLLQFELSGTLMSRITRLGHSQALLQTDMNHKVRELYHAMDTAYMAQRNQLENHEQRLDRLEQNQAILNWRQDIALRTFNGKRLSDYETPVAFLLLALDFYRITEGHVENFELKFQGALKECQLDQKLISVAELSTALQDKKHQRALASVKNTMRIPQTTRRDAEDWTVMLTGDDLAVTGADVKLEPELLAHELFYCLKANGWKVRKPDEFGLKSGYLGKCRKLREILDQQKDLLGDRLLPELQSLEQQINDWYFKVYLIGDFSCGKSTLLNRFLGEDILPSGIAPETAVATELFFSHDEYMDLWPVNGNTPERIPGVTSANLELVKRRANRGELLKVSIHVNNPMMATYGDICLVDMPGLHSTIPAHEFALSQFINSNESEAIFCVRAKAGTLNQNMLEFLNRMSCFRCGFHLLLTCADQVTQADGKEIYAQVKAVLQDKLGIDHEDLHGGMVSRDDITDFLTLLDQLGTIKEEIFRDVFDEKLASLCREPVMQLEKLLNRELSTADLDAEIRKLESCRKDLPSKITGYVRDLDREIPASVTKIVERLKSALQSMRSELLSKIKNNQDCAGEVSSQMRLVLQEKVRLEAYQLFGRIQRNVQKDLEEAVSCPTDFDLEELADFEGVSRQTYQDDGIAYGSMGGTLAGGAAGFALGGPVGALIGAAGGFLVGGLGGKKIGASIDRDSDMDSKLHMQLDQTAENSRPAIDKALKGMKNVFAENLRQTTDKKLERLSDELKAIQQQKEAGLAKFQQHQDSCAEALAALKRVLEEDMA